MEIRGIKYILPLILLLTACQKEDAGDTPANQTESKALLEIKQEVADVEASTRSVVGGTTLAENGRTYGLIVCKHEDTPTDYEIYDKDDANIYGNIQGWYGNYNSKGTGWWYSYEATVSARFKPLFLFTNDVSKHLDIYAYAPWKSGITIQDGYPYNLTSTTESNIQDLMYATYEDGGGSPTNSDLAIASNTTIPVTVHFHHALSRIVFHLKLANSQNTGKDGQHAIRLYQISLLHKTGAATPLYTTGNMNLITGAVTTGQTVSQKEQYVTYATSQSTTDGIGGYDIYQSDVWKSFNMLVHPTTYLTDGDFSFRFYFNGTSEFQQTLTQTYEIKRSDLLHSDGTTCGFQPGCCYHFYFVIDNYIHLQNVKINRDWTLNDEEEIKV